MNSLERLKQLILESGITQSEIAKKIGVSDPALSNKLNTAKIISADLAVRMLRVFPDMNLNWLYTGNGTKFNHQAIADMKAEITGLRQHLAEMQKECEILEEKVQLYKRIVNEIDHRSVSGDLG